MRQRNGTRYLAVVIIVFAELCVAATNEYPMVSSIINEARALRISGDVYKADALLTRAQRIAPRSADVYLEIAHLRKAQGDYTGLREVVDFGADIADGPPASIAQLRILREKLTVLLPLDAETPFQLPPAVAVKSESIDEEISKQSKSAKPPLDRESEEPIADSGVNENLVGDSGDGTREIQSKTTVLPDRQKEKSVSINAGNAATNQQRPRFSEIDSEKSNKLEKGEKRVSSIVKHTPGESSGSVTTDEKSFVSSKTQEIRTQFVGVGILARPQSGSWISRGSIERDY